MFSDSKVKITGFDPCSEEERLISDDNCQTETIKISDQGTQTAGKQSMGIQAVPEEPLNFINNSVSYDANRLSAFLKRVLPHLEEELSNCDRIDDNLSFNEENTGFGNEVEGVETYVKSPKQILIQPEYCKEKVISKLAWNSTGMLLALAYSERNHEGWCCHETSVGLYNTGRSKFEKHPPAYLLNASSCVRCVQFHPYVPSVLAGGFYSGEVVVWDLRNDEKVLMTKVGGGDKEAHTDVITCLTWREDRNGIRLVTTGRDGKIIFWKVTVSNLTYEVHERFLICKKPITSIDNTFYEHLEVFHIDFWPQLESDFIVAASGGSVFHCSLRTAKNLSPTSNYKDPVCMSYQPHKGIVTSVSCLTHSDLFASCGTDSEIHIYKSQASSPLHIIHTDYELMGIKWTKTPKCLLSWGCSSKIECHKINIQGIHNSRTVFEGEHCVTCIASNSVSQGKMAVGNETGEVLLLSDVAV